MTVHLEPEIHLGVDVREREPDLGFRLAEVVRRYPGNHRIYIHLVTSGGPLAARIGVDFCVDAYHPGLHADLEALGVRRLLDD